MTETSSTPPIHGFAYVVIAMFILGLIDNFVANIAAEVSVWQFHFLRSLAMCFIVWALSRIFGWRLMPLNWKAVALRSFFFSFAMVLYFGSLGGLSVAQAGAGIFSSPIFVLLISAMFLGTRIGIWRILAVAVGFSGVLLILKPWSDALSVLVFLPVLAGFFYALSGIATRRWCDGENTVTLLMGLFAALGLWGLAGVVWLWLFPASGGSLDEFAFFTRGWVTPSPMFWVWFSIQVFGSMLAVALLTRGYQSAEVSFVAVFEYSFLLFAGFWGFILHGTLPDSFAFLGIALIIGSGTIIALRSR